MLGIVNESQINTHPLKGAIFETLIISELIKYRYNQVKTDNLYYFRDNIGNEVDVIMDYGTDTVSMEIKSGLTVSTDFFKGLDYFKSLSKTTGNSLLVYGGDKSYERENISVISWKDLDSKIANSR